MEDTQRSNVEPTQQVSYEYTLPDPYELPPIPPSLPLRHPFSIKRLLVIGSFIILLVSTSVLGILYAISKTQSVKDTPVKYIYVLVTPMITPITQASRPIITPTSPVMISTITAIQIYIVFEHHGLTKNDGVENDDEYQSQGIDRPQGGVVDFTDAQSGQLYTISVFATDTKASQAATILFNGGDNVYTTDGFCMLHVNLASHASDFAIKQYTSIMDTLCR